jgi:hypothetical protein
VEENIWAYEGRGNRGVEKTHNEELNYIVYTPYPIMCG